MDFESACKWLSAIDVLESQEVLFAFKAADFPHLKRKDREKIHREIHKKAFPPDTTSASPLSLADAAKKIIGLSFPMRKG